MATTRMPRRRGANKPMESPRMKRQREAEEEQEEEVVDVEVVDEEEPEEQEEEAPEEQEEEEEKPKRKPRAKKKAAAKKVSSSKQVATSRQSGPVAGFEGDMDSDDFEMPTFKLLHQMSDDAEDMPDAVGHMVWNKEIDLGEELDIVIVRWQKKFREVVDDWDPDNPPQEYDTKAEALEDGVRVKPMAIVDILIPCSEEWEDESMFDIEGEPYVIARWYLATNYRKVAGPLSTHLNKGVDASVSDRWYKLTVVKLPGKGRRRAIVLKPTQDETSDDLRSTALSFSSE